MDTELTKIEKPDSSTRKRQPRMSIGVAVGQSQVVLEETSEEAQTGETDSAGIALTRLRRAENTALAAARKSGLGGGQGGGFESLGVLDGETSEGGVPEAAVSKGRRYSSAVYKRGDEGSV